MKLKFKKQAYQTDATSAAVNLFAGQEKIASTFTVMEERQLSLLQNEYGYGNALLIDHKKMLENMQEVQRRFNLPLTNDIEDKRFCIDMETATGKTFVYT